MLGEAEHFETVANVEHEATVVKLERGGEVRVLLLRPLPDGTPIVETLNSELAAAAGRSQLSDIDGLSVDLSQFAGSVLIGVKQDLDVGELSKARTQDDALAADVSKSSSDGDLEREGQIDVAALIASDPAGVTASAN